METRAIWRGAFLAGGVIAIALAVSIRMTGQSSARDARMLDGKPNLNGIWQAMNTANWDLLAHTVRPAVSQPGVYANHPVLAAPVLALGVRRPRAGRTGRRRRQRDSVHDGSRGDEA